MKLMIRETVFEVLQFLWENRPDLVRMIAAPVLALSILHMALATVFKDYAAAKADGITMLQFFALVVAIALPTVFYVMFAVAWHRRCLRPEEQTTILIALISNPPAAIRHALKPHGSNTAMIRPAALESCDPSRATSPARESGGRNDGAALAA